METIKFNGKLKLYLMLPIFMSIAFVAGVGLAFSYSVEIGLLMAGIFAVYLVVVLVFYNLCKNRFAAEIVDFATHYGTVQSEIIHKFNVPYAILDSSSKFMWMNDQFSSMVDKEIAYNKSVSTIFPEITKELIDRSKEDKFDVNVEYGDKRFRASLEKIGFPSFDEDAEITTLLEEQEAVVVMILFDETELIDARQRNFDEAVAMGMIYIDNFEENVESVENVKRSMLRALIDREISKYFAPFDAIVRRVEKDKYIFFLKHKHMDDLIKDNFSILESIRSVKMGNETDITLSIGIGVSEVDFNTLAEYSHTAIDVALARGGAQAVIKDAKEVAYFGSKGREVESTSRVKARVKAQAFRDIMASRDSVIIMGHKIADADCIGSATGVYCAAKRLGKKAHIVMNTVTSGMRPLIESFTESGEYPEDMFVDSTRALELINDRTLVVVVDTNRVSYVDCSDILSRTNQIVVIDHHRRSDDFIENPLLSYVEPYASSASEMITEMLQYFDEKMEINAIEADCIYAGILIDTNNFMTKTGVRTFEAAAYLRRNGADVSRVRKLLREDMSAYKARAEVVRHAEVYKGMFAVSICTPDENVESPTIVAAKAANELLNIVGIKASFVLTEWGDTIYVSSRSIDEINVQEIMERLGGGGHLNVAGAQIHGSTINEVKVHIKVILDDMIEKGEIKE